MVKSQHVWIKYNSLQYCCFNGLICVAIGNIVRKWRIFELFWQKSGIVYFRTRSHLNRLANFKFFRWTAACGKHNVTSYHEHLTWSRSRIMQELVKQLMLNSGFDLH